ncbi:MAG: phosphoadenosine phosphosulfate reductase [Saprospiraceae bacterium]|jgi:phosphoadenosine phosphosulfate reductase
MLLKISSLNKRFEKLSIEERINQLYEIYDESEILYTSSFGTSAVFLIFLINKLRPTQKIHFIDTGFHFKETMDYKKELTTCYNLNTETINFDKHLNQYATENELWKTNPNMCCQVNKVEPLEVVKQDYKIWISGLMAFQSPTRKDLNIFEQQDDIIKFYPLIDITEAQLNACKKKYNLPEHPLLSQGYESVGCTHCTMKGDNRSGRWTGNEKVECGLHLPVETEKFLKV